MLSSIGAILVAALNAVPALFGAWRWRQGESSRAFWILLRVGQAAAVLLAVAVGVLAAAGHYSSERLFYLYALLPLAMAFIAEQLRDRLGADGARSPRAWRTRRRSGACRRTSSA